MAQIGDGERSALSLPQLCAACTEVTSLRASIVLLTEGRQQAAMAASDGAAAVEDLQLTLGEGPGVDAYRQSQPILVADLAEGAVRWAQFVPAAGALGVGAAFAFPLQLGAINIGVLSLYADRPSPLVDGQLGDLLALADLVSGAVLAMQSGVVAEELAGTLASAAEPRAVVHQATGMVAMQVDCSMQDAFVRLRARAFADGIALDDLARQVVEGQIRFEP